MDAQPAASRKTLEWDVKGAAICYPGAGGGGVGAYRSGVIAIWAPSHLRRSTSVLFLVGGHYNSLRMCGLFGGLLGGILQCHRVTQEQMTHRLAVGTTLGVRLRSSRQQTAGRGGWMDRPGDSIELPFPQQPWRLSNFALRDP